MCLKLDLLDLNRYQIQYSLRRSDKKSRLVGNKPMQIDYLTVQLTNSDTVDFSFTKTFPAVPNAIAGLLTNSESVGNNNVYISSLSSTGGTVKSSSPITAKVIVQAVYFEP